MSDCTHDYSFCGKSCGGRTVPQDFRAPASGLSHIGKVIAMVSGRGGVGESLVTSSLVVATRRMGKAMGILDANITGPSIPTAFGIHTKTEGSELGIYSTEAKTDIEITGLDLLTENRTDPVVWRGPVIAGAVKQFWTDVIWGDVDYLFVDMPPGTGDVPLTVFQSLPMDSIVVVTTPQDLVSMIITKIVKVAKMMYIPVLGPVENYSYFRRPDCGKEHIIFGESRIERVAATPGLKVLARLPIDPAVVAVRNTGRTEELEPNYLAAMARLLAEQAGHSFTKYSYSAQKGFIGMEQDNSVVRDDHTPFLSSFLSITEAQTHERRWTCVFAYMEREIIKIRLELVIVASRAAVERLKITPGQEGFMESVAECLAEVDRRRRWWPVGVYNGDVLTGFVMYGFFWEHLPFGQLWLDRLLIDHCLQGRGYGQAALAALLERLEREYHKE